MPLGLCAQSTINPIKAYAYGANVGWIYFRPTSTDGVVVHEYHLSGKAYGANVGWIDFGKATPGAGHIHSNTSADDFGVNQDGSGNLFGYAYSANLGWISFEWTDFSHPNRPRFHPMTGEFSGYAYSANAGWISLQTGQLKTDSITVTDSDGDGIGDEWELAHLGELTTMNAVSDYDHDGVSDRAEYAADTLPYDPADKLSLRIAFVSPEAPHIASLEWPSKSSRAYRLFDSPNLEAASWESLTALPLSGTGGTMIFDAVSEEPRRFYRLQVSRPLVP